MESLAQRKRTSGIERIELPPARSLTVRVSKAKERSAQRPLANFRVDNPPYAFLNAAPLDIKRTVSEARALRALLPKAKRPEARIGESKLLRDVKRARFLDEQKHAMQESANKRARAMAKAKEYLARFK